LVKFKKKKKMVQSHPASEKNRNGVGEEKSPVKQKRGLQFQTPTTPGGILQNSKITTFGRWEKKFEKSFLVRSKRQDPLERTEKNVSWGEKSRELTSGG